MTHTATKPATNVPAPRGKRPPGPHGHFLLGSMPELRRDSLGFLLALSRQYGDLIRYRFALWPTYFVNHPDAIKRVLQENNRNYNKDVFDYKVLKKFAGNGLLVNDGTSWLHQRRLIQPAFHRQRIAGFGALMTQAASQLGDAWEGQASTGEPLDVAQEMMRLTLRVVGEALFGADVSAQASQIGQAFATVNTFLGDVFYNPLLLLPGLPTARKRRFQEARATFERVVSGLIANRRQQPGEQDNLLAMLLEARDAETGAGMDDAQVFAEAVTLLVAGHETTAVALSWIWYLLSEHPEAEARLHAELARVLGGRVPTVDDLPNLPYTRMVLEESMRLYPPAWSFTRKAVAADEISGYPVPANTIMLISPYTMHRHPAFWERPDEFDPERFAPERAANRPHFAYFPFGGGPRQCIGNVFAMTEAQLVLATLAQRYRLRHVPGHPVEPLPLITLRPKYGMLMTLERREKEASCRRDGI